MPGRANSKAQRARSASGDELRALLHTPSEEVLVALLENPQLDESHLAILLARKDVPGALLERIAGHPEWTHSYAVKRAIATHPHTPHLLATALVRQLYLFDLVAIGRLPSAPAEIQRLAEELVLGRLPSLPLGQKLALARRGSGRLAAALLEQGLEAVVPLALDNALLTEAHVLRILAREALPAQVVAAIARHRKWSYRHNVRLALVRDPQTPLARVLAFLPELGVSDLRELAALNELAENLRQYIHAEIARRSRSRVTFFKAQN